MLAIRPEFKRLNLSLNDIPLMSIPKSLTNIEIRQKQSELYYLSNVIKEQDEAMLELIIQTITEEQFDSIRNGENVVE